MMDATLFVLTLFGLGMLGTACACLGVIMLDATQALSLKIQAWGKKQ